MSLTFHIRVAHFFPMPKRTSIFKNHLCLLSHTHTHKHTHTYIYIYPQIYPYIYTNTNFSSLPNLEAQIKCVQSWYAAVQKYP